MLRFPQKDRKLGQVRLADASQIVDAMSEVSAMQVPARQKLSLLLDRLSDCISRDLDYHLILLDKLDRIPVPRVLDRVTFGPTLEAVEPRDHREVQELLDLCGPIFDQTIPHALRRLRTPSTYIYSRDAEPEWFERVYLPNLLVPKQWADTMTCYWAGSTDRLIIYNVFRPLGSNPFSDVECDMLSLMTRAAAPMLDTELFHDLSADIESVDPSLKPVLLCVLQGHSDQEIAKFAGVLVDYVQIAIKALLTHFKVSTRGQLMAQFVDRRVVRWLEAESNSDQLRDLM